MSMTSDELERYYDESYPPSLWTAPVATGATAGIPGTWTPAGSSVPADVAATIAAGVVASPATPWTTGQYVQTQTAGVAGRTSWSGTSWVGGAAPPPPEPEEDAELLAVRELPADVAYFTVDAVKAHVQEHPDDVDELLAAELERGDDARSTLVAWLESHGAGEAS